MERLKPEASGFRLKLTLPLSEDGAAAVWVHGGVEESALFAELVDHENVVPLLSDVETREYAQLGSNIFLISPTVPDWPRDTHILCLSPTTYGDPAVAVWTGARLLLVASGDACWGVTIPGATIAFRHGCTWCMKPDVLPDGLHALAPAEGYVDCIGPTGELLWFHNMGEPCEHRVLEDGNVRIYNFDDTHCVTIDRWTGEVIEENYYPPQS